MATSIPVLWECLVNSVVYNESGNWQGWLLSYATRNVLEGYRIRRNLKTKSLYDAILKPLHLCWKLECKNDDLELDPPGGFNQYLPVFTLCKLQHCLSEIRSVEVFETIQQLADKLMDGEVASSTEVFAIFGCHNDMDIPGSFTVRDFFFIFFNFYQCGF
jgi:hypothetical protein